MIELQDQNNDIGFVSEKKRERERGREGERERAKKKSEGKKVQEIKDTS